MSSAIEHLDPDTGDGEKEPRDALRRRQLIEARPPQTGGSGIGASPLSRLRISARLRKYTKAFGR